MFKIYLYCILSLFVVTVKAVSDILSDEFIDYINSTKPSWTAGRNFPINANIDAIRKLNGAAIQDPYYTVMANAKYELINGSVLPIDFDSREKWPQCPTLYDIREQGACASCWAVAAVATMTDRVCTYSNGSQHYYFSSADLHNCCIQLGCSHGGHVSLAWQYWNLFGIVSGGKYNTTDGCKPFNLPPCDFDQGCNKTATLPICLHKCREGYYRSYKKDKRYGKRVYTIRGGEDQIKLEIYKNGPVEAVMIVYADFIHYKSGVYRYVDGEPFGGHAVKLLGWGVDNGHKYWLAANSWGERWGDGGFFKIVRGEEHCRIESVVVAGEPALEGVPLRKDINLNLFDKVKIQFQWKF